jgi:hypothetical protein
MKQHCTNSTCQDQLFCKTSMRKQSGRNTYIVTSMRNVLHSYKCLPSNGYKGLHIGEIQWRVQLNSFNRSFHKASIAEKTLQIFNSCVVPLSLPSHHYVFTITRDIPKWCEHVRHLSQIISEKEWRWHLQIVTSVANFSVNNLTWLWSRPDLIPVSKTTTVSSLQLQTIKSCFHLTISLQEDEQFNQHWNWWNVQKLCTADCQEKSEVKTYNS